MARRTFERARRLFSGSFLSAFVVVAVLNRPPERPILNESMETAGFGLLILAMMGRLWAGLYLSGRKSKILCRVGPYALSRNPLYFFSFLGTMGLGLLSQSLVLLAVLAVVYLVYYHFVISDEEQRLASLFGAEFDDYRRQVPRLFPRSLRPRDGWPEMTVQTRSFMRQVRDTSMFLWAFFVFEAVEAFATGFGWRLPYLFHLP